MNKDEFTNKVTHLEVNKSHTLWVHDWGNPEAKTPIIFLHGGPGSQCKDSHKKLFDPNKQRVIFFDQRGAGQSLPYGSITDNTTDDLIGDINAVADHCKVGSFVICGGSWGSCLALAYAIKHTDRLKGMVLSGIFTGSQEEAKWLNQGLFKTFYPEVWEQYLRTVPKSHQTDPTSYHFDKMLHGSKKRQKRSAYDYMNLEGKILQLDDFFMPVSYEDFEPEGLIIAAHYFSNDCFLPSKHVLKNAHKIKAPVTIVQGRYDMICPPKNAFALHENLPGAELITALSGHRNEHENVQLIRQALRQLT
ncbi:MAG: alpha/beta fold hydrolase [Candidatus Saccharibacteria bacterium]|nr:alpha/beta fold hydrolase [Candidatus Saccharibacteria bacterium]